MLQKIQDGEKIRTIIMDGAHGKDAYALADEKEIEVTFWKDEVLDKEKNLEELRCVKINKKIVIIIVR